MKEPAPLPDDLLDYLAAERAAEVPERAKRERMFARLAPFLPPIGGLGGGSTGGVPTDFGGGAPPAAGAGSLAGAAGAGATAAANSVWQSKLVVAAIAAALGAGGGAATHAVFGTPRPVPVLVANPQTTGLAAPMEQARAAATTEPPSEAAATSASAPASARAPADDRARPAAASLRAERLLIETANAALLRGDHASALAALRKHASTFPKGELAQERELLMVQALKAAGENAAAEQRAKEFKQKFPGSMQEESVDKASRPR